MHFFTQNSAHLLVLSIHHSKDRESRRHKVFHQYGTQRPEKEEGRFLSYVGGSLTTALLYEYR